MVEASGLSCGQCGGSFELTALVPEVDCPYCGHHHVLTPELLQRMRAYRATVDQRLSQMAEHGVHVAAADRFVESYGSRGGFFGAYLLVGGLPLLLTGGLLVAGTAMPAVQPWTLAVTMGATTALVFLVARLGFGAKASDTEPVSVGDVDLCCPECGAAGVLGAGDAVGICRFCKGQLLATAVAVERGVGAARLAERRAAAQRYIKEREVMLHINRPPKIMGLLVPLLVVAALGGIVYAAFTEGGPVEGMAMLAGAAVITAIIGVVMVRNGLRERRRRHAIRDLTHQLGGRASYGAADVIAWLNRYWAASYPLQRLYTEGHVVEATTGYPTMVSLKTGGAEALFAEALFAADMTGAADNPAAKRHGAWLRELGFTVRVTDAGLSLEASPQLRARFAADATTLRLFAPALVHGARLLAAMGARSVGAFGEARTS